MSSARVFHVVEMPNARGDYHVQGTDMVLYDVSPNAKSMLGALYNKWQTVEGFGKDGVIFVTPFGMFATYSYHVGPIEEIVAVANRLERDWNKVGDRIENDVRASMGFGPAAVKRITDQYGHKYADWPAKTRNDYWRVEEAAHQERIRIMGKT